MFLISHLFFRYYQLSGPFLVVLVLIAVLTISISHDKLPFPHVATALSESKRTFYACGEYYFHRLHCDPTLNRMEGYDLNGSSTLVYSIANDRTFTTSKQGKGLELYASHKEAVRFTNVTGADLPHFSASFWIKRVPQSEVLYGHILSVASPYNKSGWFFDMKNVSNEIEDQRIGLGGLFDTKNVSSPDSRVLKSLVLIFTIISENFSL